MPQVVDLLHPDALARVASARLQARERHKTALARLTASLRPSALPRGQGADKARDPRGLPASEVSTAHTVCDTEVRAARAQCDTTG